MRRGGAHHRRPPACTRFRSGERIASDVPEPPKKPMTSVATHAPTERARLDRVAAVTALACAGALAAALTAWFVTRSPILAAPVATGVLRGVYVAAYAAVGAYTLRRRPTSRLGPLLAAIAFVYALSSLNASGDGLEFTLGMLLWAAYVVVLVSMALCFPRTRPGTRLERSFLRALALGSAVLWALILVFAEKLPRAGEFADCGTKCPANALQLVEAPAAVGSALDAAYQIGLALTLLGVAALLFVKARSPARLRRRAIEPLSYVMTATIAAFLLDLVVVGLFPGTKTAFMTILAVVALAAPVAILLGQVRGRMFTATSAGRLVAAMSGRAVTARGVQSLLREALGDPTLVLALPLPGSGAFVDADGGPVDLAEAAGRAAVTPVVSGGATVAALVHDPALDADDAVVEGLAASSLMLLDNARLVDELRASRGRIVAAAERERLRLERDLHDGAQQRLMAIQIKLALLRDRVGEAGLVAEIDEIGADAAAAVDELRGLAHGIYPTVLRERGLGDGLRSLARTAPLPVEVVDEGIGRCGPAVEAAVYFCAAEAIQNATKHAGSDARVTVVLGRSDGDARFAVVDDGGGFDAASAGDGLGLVSMRDRIGAVGGELEVVSSPGRGTAVRGRAPAGDG
jgi:signal transduction histidine kinase